MRLDEAYKRLKFDSPVDRERAAMEACESTLDMRNLGTSAKMLVELYLDLEIATRRIGIANLHRLKFVVIAVNPDQCKYLRALLHTIHEQLDLDVDISRVRFFPHDVNGNTFRQIQYYSWGVFCDHAVKELTGAERTFGPYGLVRAIKRDGKHYVALDRDGKRICKLTRKGMNDLIDQATCPIHYRESLKTQGTTFAAWGREDLLPRIRMARAFKL